MPYSGQINEVEIPVGTVWEITGGGGGGSVDPATATPLMDGTGAVGTSAKYAREDHVHPSDTSKQDTLVSGTNIKTINGNSLLGSGDLTTPNTMRDPATNAPLMDGTAAVGTSAKYAREDHVHPTDTSRQETLVSGTNIKTINGSSILGSGDLAVNVLEHLLDSSNNSGLRQINSAAEDGTYAVGGNAAAFGYGTKASGVYSFAEGLSSTASGYACHAEGEGTTASNIRSHAEGYMANASGAGSHAEGRNTIASSDATHAEGGFTSATGVYSHSEGEDTMASGRASHAGGINTIAQRMSQTVIGEYNIADTDGSNEGTHGKYAFIVGNGTSDTARSNAFTVGWDGNVRLALDTSRSAPGTVDYQLYEAILALGWENDVID